MSPPSADFIQKGVFPLKKALSLLLLAVLLCTLSACKGSVTDWKTVSLTRTSSAPAASVSGEPVAVALSPDSPFGGIELRLEITGDSPKITISIYEATVDYQTTLSQKPVRKESVDRLSERILWQFRTLPAGDYLIVVSQMEDAALKKAVVPSDEANGKILHYCNGEIRTDGTPEITLLCIPAENSEPGLETFYYPVLEE